MIKTLMFVSRSREIRFLKLVLISLSLENDRLTGAKVADKLKNIIQHVYLTTSI